MPVGHGLLIASPVSDAEHRHTYGDLCRKDDGHHASSLRTQFFDRNIKKFRDREQLVEFWLRYSVFPVRNRRGADSCFLCYSVVRVSPFVAKLRVRLVLCCQYLSPFFFYVIVKYHIVIITESRYNTVTTPFIPVSVFLRISVRRTSRFSILRLTVFVNTNFRFAEFSEKEL